MMRRSSQGVHGSGGKTYTGEQYRRVVDALLAATEPMTVEELSEATYVGGRTIRAIVSDADGVDFLLGGNSDKGYILAKAAWEADRIDKRMSSQIAKMCDRRSRRREYARKHLQRSQMGVN
jgi:hypothetical protein